MADVVSAVNRDFMHYSCTFELIGKEVDVRVTDSSVEIFYKQDRIAFHMRLHGRRGQYSTIQDHMPEKHQLYQEWNSDRFRQWASKIGTGTYKVVDFILTSKAVEEQTCMNSHCGKSNSIFHAETNLHNNSTRTS